MGYYASLDSLNNKPPLGMVLTEEDITIALFPFKNEEGRHLIFSVILQPIKLASRDTEVHPLDFSTMALLCLLMKKTSDGFTLLRYNYSNMIKKSAVADLVITERSAIEEQLKEKIDERDGQLAERDGKLAEQKVKLAERDGQLAEEKVKCAKQEKQIG